MKGHTLPFNLQFLQNLQTVHLMQGILERNWMMLGKRLIQRELMPVMRIRQKKTLARPWILYLQVTKKKILKR